MTTDTMAAKSSEAYSSIAIVGAGGYGELFLKALKQSGFFVKVRAVTRAPEATETVKLERLKKLRALGIEVLEYTSVTADEFSRVFAGIDTVVSAVAVAGLLDQIPMIDGAVAAGVKWFIPSEFGVAQYQSAWMPFKGPLAAKEQVLEYLVGTARPKGLAYTAVYTGLALDYLDPHVIGLKLSKRRATLVGRGATPATFTCAADVVKVLVSIVQRPSEMQNRVIRYAGSTNKMRELIKVVTGNSCGNNVKIVSIDEARLKFCELARQQDMKAFQVYGRLLIEEGMAQINLRREPLDNGLFPDIKPESATETLVRLIKLAEAGSEMFKGGQIIHRSHTASSVTDGVGEVCKQEPASTTVAGKSPV
ncbi:hypothetical protein IWW57_004650 [Coemansia sp. S610]|uniref:Uncharacterized protein n=1 Tax=Coemansia linderi TaxID=2663919 RepID=A0ACC1KF68_9FUNG|nr:hypothetical protein LPJ60_004269 [Coemansia sp. RSA 2675]KAJ2022118.1 hypothetical protein IWW57_004650 [Coemansia sp. S610]KAJ2380222.1 hypothetical protein H4S02_006791 [Coemansia sp. RSA 2611]KAJ2416361.1 hypothetical protein GGI10_001023 [Coemansia sp. RSA 2530]KAJ2788748.1 hypothetical protein GGI18_002779 [Coemansia linderi]